MRLEGATEVSVILAPGVYALVKRGVVIYVGKSKSVYQRIYAHRTTAVRSARGQKIPTWLPAKGFVFDQVFVWPCALADLAALEAEMINRYKPRYNQSLKLPGRAKPVTEVRIGATVIALRPEPEIRRI